jgi:hypothetical protein
MVQLRKQMTYDRLGRLLAGLSILVALTLAHFVSPWFLLAAVGTGLNLVFSGITDRCAIRNLMIRLGIPGERDLGRAEVVGGARKPRSHVFPGAPRQSRVTALMKQLDAKEGGTP